jgi:outer membrane protein assembly factor BamB
VLAVALSGIGTAAAEEPVPDINHPPMPVPEMPVPEGFGLIAPVAPPALAPVPLEAPIPLAPALTTGFPGLGDNICSLFAGGCSIPPDTHGAVGPNHLMEVLNTQVQVQDRTGAVVWGPVEIDDFWAPVNPPIPPAAAPDGVFDPRVHYDPFDDRWITVACDEKAVPNPDQSAILVGVSQTGDPTAAWFRDRIDVDGANQVWADYPNVGFNGKWVAVQVNMFNVSDSQFNRSHIYVFDKTELYAGTFNPTLFTLLTLGQPPAERYGGTQVPAATYDAAEGDLYLLQKWNAGAGLLRLYWITGPAGAPVLLGLNTDTPRFAQSPVPWDRSAPAAPDPINFAPQIEPPIAVEGCQTCLSGPCRIQTNDDRIQNAVLRNGTLWATHTIFLPAGGPTRSSLQWWQLDPLNPLVPLQRGRVDDPTGSRFFAFPSIAVNKHDDVLLGYSSFEGTQYPSGSYSFRTAFDPPNTMQPESIMKDGEACYLKDFTDFGTGRNRWGDYSATVVDADDTKLWTLQEYAAFPDVTEPEPWFRDKWGTWWGMLDTTRTITIADASVAEGNAGPTSLVFDLTLSQPTPLTVTVEWATQDDTATTADSDYVGVVGGVVTFPPGAVSQTLTVDVVGDLKYEADETFFVNLTNPTNADIADAQAVGTILNDEPLPLISVNDVSLLEGDAGPDSTSFVFTVALDRLSSTDVQANWATTPVGATATAGPLPAGDYSPAGGTVTVPAGSLSETLTVAVTVHGDLASEADEAFYVELSSPVGAALLKPRGAGIILNDDAPTPPVEAFTAVTGLPVGSGETLLQWVNPAGANPNEVVIRYNPGNGCGFPANAGDGSGVPGIAAVDVGNPQSHLHLLVTNDMEYCYSAFLRYGVAYSTKVDLKAIPFNSTGKLKWRYFTPATVLAAPTVGVPAVTALSNDMYVHAMLRGGATGGPWLGLPWRPWHLGAIAQHRAPTVPLPAGSRAYIATQDGRVHAIDTDLGTPLWTTQLAPNDTRGAPAGIFTAFGGAWDYVFVGTSEVDDNVFYALDPFTGAVVDTFNAGGGIGAILGMPAVDYANRRVYFTSQKGSDSGTVWCLDLGPPGPGALTLRWKSDVPASISGSPVLIRGRVYAVDVGSNAWSIEAVDNLDERSFSLGDGDGKGFLFPDWRNFDLYLTTQTKVHGLIDDTSGGGWSRKWPEISLSPGAPSAVLFWAGTDSVYVGVDDHPATGDAGGVLHIDTTTGTIVNGLQLDSAPQVIGSPSLDIGYDLLHVGSEAGILYAVEVPF